MKDEIQFKIIATIKTDFKTKFGIPRQSGLVKTTKARIIFEPEYRNQESLRGIEGYSHLWILWKFSQSVCEEWSPTVRPPRLGGNKRVGVFATRSPFRPNPIGLSSVKLEKIVKDEKYGLVLEVSGADLLDGTPIYDIKPYIAFTDSHPDAVGGFADEVFGEKIEVQIPDEVKQGLTPETITNLIEILRQDPRPAYIENDKRVYSFEYNKYKIRFFVEENILKVISAEETKV